MILKRNQYEIILSPEAEEELISSMEFYEQKMLGLGEDFVLEVDNTFDRIKINPEQFPKIKKKQVRKAWLKRFPFGIYFAVNDTIINILAIFHHSRNPKQLVKRL